MIRPLDNKYESDYEVLMRDIASAIYESENYARTAAARMSDADEAYKILKAFFSRRTNGDAELPFDREDFSVDRYAWKAGSFGHRKQYKMLVLNLPALGLRLDYRRIVYMYNDNYSEVFGAFVTQDKDYPAKRSLFLYNDYISRAGEIEVREYQNVNRWINQNANADAFDRISGDMSELYKLVSMVTGQKNPSAISYTAI